MQFIDRPVDYQDIIVGLPTHIFTAQKDRFFEGYRPQMPNFVPEIK